MQELHEAVLCSFGDRRCARCAQLVHGGDALQAPSPTWANMRAASTVCWNTDCTDMWDWNRDRPTPPQGRAHPRHHVTHCGLVGRIQLLSLGQTSESGELLVDEAIHGQFVGIQYLLQHGQLCGVQ